MSFTMIKLNEHPKCKMESKDLLTQ